MKNKRDLPVRKLRQVFVNGDGSGVKRLRGVLVIL